MSISTISDGITRTQKEIADIQHKISQESKKEADCLARIGQIQRSITNSTSASTLRSKRSEVERKQSEIAKIQVHKADYQKKLADKEGRLLKLKQDLQKEEEKERKKKAQEQDRERRRLADLDKRVQREQLDYQRRLQEEIRATNAMTAQMASNVAQRSVEDHTEYDLFISHAAEDKEDLVDLLAESLKSLGVRVWYDSFTLRVGDSLREKIDQGLAKSRYGTIVLSSAFCAKNWTQYELNSMVAREMNGHKMILPIWHKISKDEVLKFSPALADKLALNTSISSIEEIAKDLADVVLDKANA
ncbi:TIR domain-containing protein [Aromatoleum toluclasticum]|uniref:TIR domain-containing protein n=1 Tax=Aromatoleum toluclasticum TaxID=92003 RepID=UPI001D183717|nr:toll/interleukin-1 receptor domain-containing protein [Aromatoleum toluclasticum]MCC4118211.1 TIR domain-containing protein [Aromatoleum toluclasticum]